MIFPGDDALNVLDGTILLSVWNENKRIII